METSSATLPPNPDPCLNVEITQELITQHGLMPDEYEQILKILGRTPNLTELGIFSVMWSEHCAYKNTRKLLKLFPTEKADKSAIGQVLVKAGEENAGVIDVGEGGELPSRLNPTIIQVRLSLLRGLQPVWAVLCGIFLPWVPVRFSLPIHYGLDHWNRAR